jgi:hypothetical protein
MFEEPSQYAELNRTRAATARTGVARLAGGEHGVVLFYDRKILLFTEQQATALATKLINTIEHAREANNHDR